MVSNGYPNFLGFTIPASTEVIIVFVFIPAYFLLYDAWGPGIAVGPRNVFQVQNHSLIPPLPEVIG